MEIILKKTTDLFISILEKMFDNIILLSFPNKESQDLTITIHTNNIVYYSEIKKQADKCNLKIKDLTITPENDLILLTIVLEENNDLPF